MSAASDPAEEFTSPDEDMAFIGFIVQGEDLMSMMMNLGTASKSHKRDGRAARRQAVSEMHLPPGVARPISPMPSLRLVPGFALDLTCIDPDEGMPWDFDIESKQINALELVRTQKPVMLIGSPMCTGWCSWQALNAFKRDPAVVAREAGKARMHLKFVISLCREAVCFSTGIPGAQPRGNRKWRKIACQQSALIES